jgi:hypothetical protein
VFRKAWTARGLVVQKEEFSITCYVCYTYTWQFIRKTYAFVRGCYMRIVSAKVHSQRKASLFVSLKGTWRQDELIGGKSESLQSVWEMKYWREVASRGLSSTVMSRRLGEVVESSRGKKLILLEGRQRVVETTRNWDFCGSHCFLKHT